MSYPIRPQNKFILVRPVKKEDVIANGGIILPGATTNKDLQHGIAVAVADDVEGRIVEGEKVLYPLTAAVGLQYKEEHLQWVREDNIWAIID